MFLLVALLGAPQALGRSVSDVRVEPVSPELSRKQKGEKKAAHGVAENPAVEVEERVGGGRGQGCSQFIKKFDFVSATNLF